MKKLLLCLLLLAGLTLSSYAATRGDVKVLEATDTIKYRINDIAKNYWLLTEFPHKGALRSRLHHDLTALSQSFQAIALTTRDTRAKGLLTYFAYQKARLEVIFDQPPSREQASEVMGISEGLVEGAEAIAKHHQYDFSFEEKMFQTTLSLSEHLEAIAKYYMAHGLAKDDPEILKKMHKERQVFAHLLQDIVYYKYINQEMIQYRDSIIQTWHTLEPYINQADKKDTLPMMVSIGTTHINTLLQHLGAYHSKNQ